MRWRSLRIAAASKRDLDTLRVFAISKLDWIKRQRESMLSKQREASRDYINRESHYFLGKRNLLKVHVINAALKVEIDHKYIHLFRTA